MPSFAYRAATAAGRTVRGVEDAPSASALERTLDARGLFALEVEPAAPRERRGGWRGRADDATEAVRYLAALTAAGFPLDRALSTAGAAVVRRDVADALSDVRERVRSGARLADALAAHPDVFPRIAVGMVRAGERGGALADALERLAGQMERDRALRARLVSALTYPAVVAVAGAAALVVLFVQVLPRFVALLEDTGSEIPGSTAALLAAGDFAARGGWTLVLLPFVLVAAAAAARRTEGGREAVDRALLAAPGVGWFRRRAAAGRVGRTLGTLLASGLPILPALETAAEAQPDGAVAADLLRAREEVRAGDRLGAALERTGVLPPLFVRMVEVGEEGGRLPEMLDRAAAAAEGELERGLDRALRLVEPAMIVLFGGLVGLVALSLLQAIYGIRGDAL